MSHFFSLLVIRGVRLSLSSALRFDQVVPSGYHTVLNDQVSSLHEQVSVPKSATQLSNALFKLLLQNLLISVLCRLVPRVHALALKHSGNVLAVPYPMFHSLCGSSVTPGSSASHPALRLCPFLLSSILHQDKQ